MASDGERDDALFVNLVMIFQGAAMQQMGKIASPLSGKVERNLEQARFSIDTLSMLREKTRGNLSEELARLLDSTLLNLRMNYVEEAAADAGAGEAAPPETQAGTATPAGDEAYGAEAPGGEGTDPAAGPTGSAGPGTPEDAEPAARGGAKARRRGRPRAEGK